MIAAVVSINRRKQLSCTITAHSPVVNSCAQPEALPPPTVTSWRGFANISEIFNHDEAGKLIFKRTTYITIDESDGKVHYGGLEITQIHITLDQARSCLREVPDHEIYPCLTPGLTIASIPDLD